VVAIALILSAVFLPTVFIPGITGRLYQQFAVTIAISVLLSAFNALTLSPALSALLLRPIIFLASGSELSLAVKAHEKLVSEGVRSRVVSIPS
jgi:multidrug efflux pump subunit AcrB